MFTEARDKMQGLGRGVERRRVDCMLRCSAAWTVGRHRTLEQHGPARRLVGQRELPIRKSMLPLRAATIVLEVDCIISNVHLSTPNWTRLLKKAFNCS